MPTATAALVALAAATAPTGTTTIAADGPVAAGLREQGVAVARQIVLPVQGGTIGSASALALRGRVTLRHGRRTLTLTQWRGRVQAGRTTLSALPTGARKRVVVLAAEVVPWRLTVTASSGKLRLEPVKVRLTRPGAKLIRTRLALETLRPGVLGHLRAQATIPLAEQKVPGDGTPGGGQTPGGGGPTGPTCEVSSDQITPAGPPMARPAGAVDVASATITWRPRDSFIRYVSSGEGAIASEGATAGPAEVLPGSATPLVYSFGFGLKAGSWYDAVSDTAGLFARGTVRFRYSGHGIDITVKDPEIELHGADSTAVFTLGGDGCTQLGDIRGQMLALAPGAPSGHDYGQIPATITSTGADMFSGFYLPGDPWGSIAVAFTPVS